MIPSRVCKRSVSRADTTALLSHKRKSSVVPAVFIAGSRRGYSVPSKRLSSATATATTTRQYDERALISQFISSPHKQNSPHVQTLLTHRLPFTFIPTPLPQGFHSPLNDLYFPSTQVQDSLAVIDACLYNCHDVPRAKVIFDDLRTRARANAIGDAGEKVAELEVGIYNNFLESFLEMASGKAKNPKKREEWIDEGWDLYAVLENEVDGIAPDERTYAIMLMMMTRYALPLLYLSVSLDRRSSPDLHRAQTQERLPSPQQPF
jgi:DNA-directed RNA polymerase